MRKLAPYLRRVFTPVLAVALLFTAIGYSQPATAATGTAVKAFATRTTGIEFARPYLGTIYPAGAGHTTGTVFVGLWSWRNELGFCIDFTRHNPSGSGTVILNGAVPGMTAAVSAKIFSIVNQYGHSRNKTEVTAAGLAVWKLRNEPQFTAYWNSHKIPQAMMNLVATMVAQTPGPFKVSVASTPVLPGQKSIVMATVTGAGNKSAPAGLQVNLAAVGGTLLRAAGVTNARGQFATTFTRTSVGAVTISVAGKLPSATHALLTIAAPGTQRLLVGEFTQPESAKISYNKQFATPTATTACTTNCDGVATVSFQVCNPAGAATTRWSWTNVATKKSLVAVIVTGGTCKTATALIPDTTKVQSSYCLYVSGKCTSAEVNVGSPAEIVCPPWASMDVPVHFGCNTCSLGSVTFTVPASTRFYVGVVTYNGKTVTTNLVAGGTTVVPLAVAGPSATLTAHFVVYSDAAHAHQIKVGPSWNINAATS